MSQNPLDVAAMAMQHPHALEILESIRSLAEKHEMTVGVNEIVLYSNSNELIFTFPRSSELQQQGVNIQNEQLQSVAKDYPERLPSAVKAWLKWVSYTPVEHPTLSLIKAIKEHWKS